MCYVSDLPNLPNLPLFYGIKWQLFTVFCGRKMASPPPFRLTLPITAVTNVRIFPKQCFRGGGNAYTRQRARAKISASVWLSERKTIYLQYGKYRL